MAIDSLCSPVAQAVARLRGGAGGLFRRSGGVVRPILWNKGSSETCVCIRGLFEEYFYDSERRLTETIDRPLDEDEIM